MFALISDLRAFGATNALAREPPPFRAPCFARAAEVYAEQFADPDGRLRATFETLWISGWAPHESQPKPLKPGSAAMRLEDALGARAGGAGKVVSGTRQGLVRFDWRARVAHETS